MLVPGQLAGDVASVEAYMISARRTIHRRPEVGFQEQLTSQFISRSLRELGLIVTSGIGGTGLLGVVQGQRARPVVMLRADMDALPISEQTGLPYSSENPGLMHACAHDMHCACLLGVGATLQKNALSVPGTVVLVFQPAEETDEGARAMLDAGIVERFEPDVVIGAHMWPDLRVGQVGISAGPVMASLDSLDIQLNGTRAHGAMPHLGRDALLAASALVMSLQQITSRNVDPMDAVALSIGTLNSGTARNIVADTASLSGTVRTLTDRARRLVEERVQEVVTACARAYGVEPVMNYQRVLPVLSNNPSICALAKRSVECTLGQSSVEPAPHTMASDDFSLYLERAVGCYLFFGCSDSSGPIHPLHNERFLPSERALPVATLAIAQLCIDLCHHFAE